MEIWHCRLIDLQSSYIFSSQSTILIETAFDDFYRKYVTICLHGKLHGTVALYFLRHEGIFLKGSRWIMRAGCHKKSVANNNGRDNYNVEANILSVHQQIPPLQSTNDYNLTISAAQFRLWLMSLNFLIINQLLFSFC